MAIRIVSNITIAPDAVESFLAYWRERSPQCRAERGCLQYQVLRSVEEPNEFALLELWTDQDAYDEHWATQRAIPDRPTFPRVQRGHGQDGIEFYEQRYFVQIDGRWVPERAEQG